MKKITAAIMAHVDAGKTSLSEAWLYRSGTIRKFGRVDHRDSFLDNNFIERQRGITVFSKQAVIKSDDFQLTLLDTPGHVDFSAEAERVMSVTDVAILVVNATEPVQSHTVTLWNLLDRYNVPVFLFVNKMDMSFETEEEILEKLKKSLDGSITDFRDISSEEFLETIALSSEELLENYENGIVPSDNDISDAISKRKIFPVLFGSALKQNGTDEFLELVKKYSHHKEYENEFGAKVFKIKYDNGERLTFMKITGGNLNVKDVIVTDEKHEKVNQIRLYSGEKYTTLNTAEAGDVVAVTGLTATFCGQGVGCVQNTEEFYLKPVLSYTLEIPSDVNISEFFEKLKQLQEEEPSFGFESRDALQEKSKSSIHEINVMIMGKVQLEVLHEIILERFGIDVGFGNGRVIYKETIRNSVIGTGHFEPLRHYAEVRLKIEPSEKEGIEYCSKCSEDVLAKNWQNLIRTHIFEKRHRGVLTASVVTNIKITLLTGRAHVKHTEGGDFRQATYRAIRNGLRKAESVLLEPYYKFTAEIPSESTGRVMTEVKQRYGTVSQPEIKGEMTVLKGTAPAILMVDFAADLSSFTKGKGHIYFSFDRYDECHNAEEVTGIYNYNPDSDLRNTADSVFCKGGVGFIVPWYDVDNYAHTAVEERNETKTEVKPQQRSEKDEFELQKELEEIFKREFRPKNNTRNENQSRTHGTARGELGDFVYKGENRKKDCLLVDGYNIIYAWQELRKIAESDYHAARDRLVEILSNYQAFKKIEVIVVFDAYKVKNGKGSVIKKHNIKIVYTKEAETADMYIERVTNEMADKYRIRVATSDGMEQMIILCHGALRVSAGEFEKEVNNINREIREVARNKSQSERVYLRDIMLDKKDEQDN